MDLYCNGYLDKVIQCAPLWKIMWLYEDLCYLNNLYISFETLMPKYVIMLICLPLYTLVPKYTVVFICLPFCILVLK